MGFTYQTYPIVGGTVLIIERVQSQNYVAGSAGWAIAANGDAEFSNLVARGTFVSGDGTGKHIVINGAAGVIELWTGDPAQELPGSIGAISSPGSLMETEITAPRAPGGVAPFISLVSLDANLVGDSISFNAHNFNFQDGSAFTGLPIRTGIVLSAAVATFQTFAVVFATPLPSVPKIVVTPVTSADVVTQVATSGATVNGFNLHFKRATAVGTNISWVAISV